MTREEALKIVRENYPHFGTTEPWPDLEKALATLIPELAESEDEKIRKLLVWQVYRNIEDETNDLAQSVYDGIKGHDPDLEESIEDWKKCLAYLEKQKEPHYTKRNALFDKCVENCDPAVMKKVSDEVDEMLEKEIDLFVHGWSIDKSLGLVNDEGWSVTVGDIKNVARHFYKLGLNARKEDENDSNGLSYIP